MNNFLLIDGNSMLFRAYYSTSSTRMTSRQGIPTNAVFGFLSMMEKAVGMIHPEAVLVAFDAGKHTFRHDLYPEYKGGRKPAPDDLVPQFALVRNLLDAYHVKWVEQPDIEADDLIGTASKKAVNYATYILTSDHDMLQLADETTSVLIMKKGLSDIDVMTPAKIEEDIGLKPIQIIDLKGLMGDTSDNYPGIPGVGEKTAVKLLQQYGSVENVLAHEDELKGALQKKVRAGHDSALLSKRLAEIRRDVPLSFTVDECRFEPDYASLTTFLKSLDMNAMAARFEGRSDATEDTDDQNDTKAAWQETEKMPSDRLHEECTVFLDEDHEHFMQAETYGLAFAFKDSAYYMTLENIKRDKALLQYLASDVPHKTGYDVKRNMHLLERADVKISFFDDAMILASLADSTLTSTDKIMEHYGLSTSVTFEDVYGKKKNSQPVDPVKRTEYACESADNVRRLKEMTADKIESYGMHDLYRNIEMPLTEILYRMEKEGIRCDIDILNSIADKTLAKIHQLEDQIYSYAGRTFNLNSSKQMAEVLYDDLGLPSGKKRSTAADKLEKLKDYHPIINDILSYRKLSKIYSTYAEGLKKYIYKDGRIHTIYNQCATQTGRLSSSEPNLQNISVRDEQGKEIRRAFLPEEGCVLMSCDYHQIELRMLAHMADEPGLIEAFNEGIDVHTKTAMDVFGVSKDQVTPLMRRQAKMVNFGIVYGISDFGLAERLGVSRQEAHDFIEKYYEKYPGIRKYMDSIVKSCQEKGYVTTLCGRRRDIPEIHDKNRMVREFGERAAMNAPIQGSAADLIKIAMIKIDRTMKEKKVKSKMILQVHDELIFNVPEDEVDLMKQLVEDGMANAMKLKVPLTSECAIGKDWYEAK